MIQRTLFDAKESPPAPAFAKPREPDTAEDLKEWSRLYLAKYGKKPDAWQQLEAMKAHKWKGLK